MKNIILTSLLFLFCIAQAKMGATLASEPNVDKVKFSQLASGVWLHTSYKNVDPWGLVFTNGLVIERDGYSVLIDTAWNDQQTVQIVEWAKSDLNKPIKSSIHTHAHSDKMGGMAALHEAGIETFASSLSNEIAPLHKLVPAKSNIELSFVGDQLKWEGLIVLYPGGGHTRDNIVVYDQEREIIFGGCLIRPGNSDSMGFTGDADLEYWSQAAQNVADAFPEGRIVVPSHGDPGGLDVLMNTIKIAAEESRKGG